MAAQLDHGDTQLREQAERLFERLPPERKSTNLRLLILAFRAGHDTHFELLIKGLNTIFTEVRWFRTALENVLGCNSQLTLPHFEDSPLSLRGNSDDMWAISTLTQGCSSHAFAIKPLLAVFAIALVHAELDPQVAPKLSSLKLLATTIRGIALRSSNHRLLDVIANADEAASLEDTCQRIHEGSEAARSKNAEFNLEWVRVWKPWSFGLAATFKRATPAPPEADESFGKKPPDTSGPQGPQASSGTRSRSNPPRRGLAKTYRVEIPSGIPAEEGEPPSEVAEVAEFVEPESPWITPESQKRKENQALYCSSIRLQNRHLLSSHIDVLAKVELKTILDGLQTHFDAALAKNEWETAGAIVVYNLVAATSRTPDVISRTPFSVSSFFPDTVNLEIDPALGRIRQRVFRPEGNIRIRPEQASLVGPIHDDLVLELPRPVAALIRRLHQEKPVQKVGDWLNGKNPSELAKEVIRKIPELPEFSASLSRARRMAGPVIMDKCHDLAVAMLLTGDNFGRSTAPLFYYAPERSHLQRIYRQAVWPLFGLEDVAGAEDPGRVGSGVNIRTDVLQRSLGSSWAPPDQSGNALTSEDPDQRTEPDGERIDRSDNGKPAKTDEEQRARPRIPRRLTKCVGQADLLEEHNRHTLHVALHFALVTTHRPTKAFTTVKRSDIDTVSRLAFIRDKQVDAAHRRRPVALSELLCRQLDAYFSRVEDLSSFERLSPKVRARLNKVLTSKGSLFPFFNASGRAERTLYAWKKRWPTDLAILPSNWYRHFTATRLRECGADATDVLLQCGHLEAADFPFSRNSPLPPLDFPQRLSEPLKALEHHAGITLFYPNLVPKLTDEGPTPFISWKRQLQQQQIDIVQSKRNRATMIARFKGQIRDEAVSLLHRILSELELPVATLILAVNKREKIIIPPLVEGQSLFSAAHAQMVLERLDSMAIQPALKLATRDRLFTLSRRMKIWYELDVYSIPKPFLLPAAEPSPFLEDQLVALRQIRSFRNAICAQASPIRNESPDLWRFLMLTVFGGVSNIAEITSAMSAVQPQGLIGLGFPCLMMSSGYGDDPALGLNSLAALGLANVPPSTGKPLSELSVDLCRWFPAFFPIRPETASEAESPLTLLLETVEINNRVELSGLARFSASQEGAVGAESSLQLAVLLGGFPRTDKNDPRSEEATQRQPASPKVLEAPPADTRRSPESKAAAIKKLKRIYLAMGVAALDQRKTSRRPSRKSIVNTLKSLGATQDHANDLRIEQAILGFSHHLASLTSADKSALAISSVRTYVSSIARGLISRFAGINLHQLSNEEFEDQYLDFVNNIPASRKRRGTRQTTLSGPDTRAKSLNWEEADSNTSHRRRAAAILLRFHNFCVGRYGVEPLESDELHQFATRSEQVVTADFVTVAEYVHAKHWLVQVRTGYGGEASNDENTRRTALVAEIVLSLLGASGARISEIMMLRHVDLLLLDDKVLAFIRPNIYRTMKTSAARRLVDLSKNLTASEQEFLKVYVAGEKLRLGPDLRNGSALLFSTIQSSRISIGIGPIRDLINQAFIKGAGRRCWPHLLRHGIVQREILSIQRNLNQSRTPTDRYDWIESSRRLLELSATTGHTELATTVRCYFHLPWTFRAIELGRRMQMEDRNGLSALSGQSLPFVDTGRRRPPKASLSGVSDHHQYAWHELLLLRLYGPATPEDRQTVRLDFPYQFSFPSCNALDRWLRRTQNIEELKAIMLAEGLLLDEIERVKASLRGIERSTKFPLLSVETKHSPRVARVLPSAQMNDFPEILDRLPDQTKSTLSLLFLACYRRRAARNHNAFMGSDRNLMELKTQLMGLGLPKLQLSRSSGGPGNSSLMTFLSDDAIGPFHRICWCLALLAVSQSMAGLA